MKMIEPVQIQLIHIAKAQLGLAEWDYRMIVMAQTKDKKQSSKELTYAEASGLIDYFKTLGFKIKSSPARRAKSPAANVVSLVSPEQTGMIQALAQQIAWRFADGYQRWLMKYLRIERIATAAQASRAIEGLKQLLKHQQEAGCRKTG